MINFKNKKSMKESVLLTSLMLVGVAFIWGGTFIAGRHLSVNTPPLLSASIRFLIASVTLSFFLPNKQNKSLLNKNTKIRIFFLGLTGIFFYNICFFYGFQFISASRGSLIVALNPAGIGLVSFIFLHEQIRPIKWLGIMLSLIGVFIIVISKDPTALSMDVNTWKGDLFLLGCVACWVTYSVASKRVISEIGTIHSVFYSLVVGTILLGVTALSTNQANLVNILELSYSQWFSLLFLGVFGSALAYVWYYKGIEKIGATQAGVYIALVPVFGIILGMLLLKEPITLPMIIGGIIVILGVYFCNWSKY
jgi:drug/metabolite transporter (DMT)-like permease